MRADNKNDHWPAKNDFTAGIRYWTDTLKRVRAARKAGMKVIPVDYDLLVAEGGEAVRVHLAGILDRLSLPYAEQMQAELLASRRSGGDAPLDASEEEVMRDTLASDVWRGFLLTFADDGQFQAPRWARSA